MTPQGKYYKKEYALELLKIAKGDLGSAKDLKKGVLGRPENICYLTQQCIEKCVKAVLCVDGKKVVHTHDLEALLNLLPESSRPKHWKELGALTEYATVRRYEEGFEIISEEDLDLIINAGQKTLEWAEFYISKSFKEKK